MSDLMFPKTSGKKKRKKHAKSIMQPDQDKHCYLCMLLHDDYHEKNVEEHHVIPGTWGRGKSEELGLKVYLCVEHHRTGPEIPANLRTDPFACGMDAGDWAELRHKNNLGTFTKRLIYHTHQQTMQQRGGFPPRKGAGCATQS